MFNWNFVDQVTIIMNQHIYRLVARIHKEIKTNFKKTIIEETNFTWRREY